MEVCERNSELEKKYNLRNMKKNYIASGLYNEFFSINTLFKNYCEESFKNTI